MPTDAPQPPQRSYGCTFGCGNPYDYIVVSVSDGSTEFLCLPCYVKLATQMVEAVTNPNGELVMAAIAEAGKLDQAPMRQPITRSRGHHAPTTDDDPDLLEAFDSVVTTDDLPDEFL